MIALEKKEEDKYKIYKDSIISEIMEINEKQQNLMNKRTHSSKHSETYSNLPNNIAFILDRKNYLQKE